MKYPICQSARAGLCFMALLTQAAMGAEPGALQPLWQLELPGTQQGRVHETAILPGPVPRVLATTPDEVLLVEHGKASTLFRLERNGALGRSALLPVVFAKGGQEGEERARIGVMLHNLHAIEGFELLDLRGNVVARLQDSRHFHFRIAPDGRSFVGGDAGNTHTPLTAKSVTYRFFDAAGRAVEGKEIVSRHPQSSSDSAYTPDGRAFLISSRDDGLAAYDSTTAQRLWVHPKAVKSFVVAGAETGLALAIDEATHHTALLLRRGEPLWSLQLAEFAPKENVRNLALSPNGHHAVVTGRSLALAIGPEHAAPRGKFAVSAGYAINSVAVNDAGVIALGAQAMDGQRGEVWLLDARTAQPLAAPLKTTHRRGNAWIPTVQWDADGRYLLVRTLESLELFGLPAANESQK